MPHHSPLSDDADPVEEQHDTGQALCEETQRLIQQAAETCAQTRALLRELEAEHPSSSGPASPVTAVQQARDPQDPPDDADE